MLPLVLCTKRRPKQITLEETSFPRTLWKSVDTHCEIVGQISLNTCSVFAAWCFTATNLWASQNPLCFFLWLFIVRHSTCERDTRVPIAFGFKLLGNTRVILSFYKKKSSASYRQIYSSISKRELIFTFFICAWIHGIFLLQVWIWPCWISAASLHSPHSFHAASRQLFADIINANSACVIFKKGWRDVKLVAFSLSCKSRLPHCVNLHRG